jgi:hypothetical protein
VDDRCPLAGDLIIAGDFLDVGIELGIEFFLPIASISAVRALDEAPRGREVNFGRSTASADVSDPCSGAS